MQFSPKKATAELRDWRYPVKSPLPVGYFDRRQATRSVEELPISSSHRSSSAQAATRTDEFGPHELIRDSPLGAQTDDSNLSKRVLRYDVQHAQRLQPMRSAPAMRVDIPLAVTRKERAKTDPVAGSRALREIIDIFDAHFAQVNEDARSRPAQGKRSKTNRAKSLELKLSRVGATSTWRNADESPSPRGAVQRAPNEIMPVALTGSMVHESKATATPHAGKDRSLIPVRNFCHPIQKTSPFASVEILELPQTLPSYPRKRSLTLSTLVSSSVAPALRTTSPSASAQNQKRSARAVHHEARAQLLSIA
ncbi:hypothetical protein CBOM_03057 [Ceraceosorus bombacis]|uniref:Uncharacterized protein n=1 Tax=Ceraceosorus bombacis TaxID=401625 RepID=A0A0P1BMX9_9BASI|nr:hypothetical protein CBOM_03057 [Ceraceosorus bombacis]